MVMGWEVGWVGVLVMGWEVVVAVGMGAEVVGLVAAAKVAVVEVLGLVGAAKVATAAGPAGLGTYRRSAAPHRRTETSRCRGTDATSTCRLLSYSCSTIRHSWCCSCCCQCTAVGSGQWALGTGH
jgi:hypothetical protein